jgi:DNA invertase Pin-like site-specific DNA recombinase
MSGVFAEFERAMIQERIMAGARVQGKRLGRRRTKGATDEAILKLRAQGLGMLTIGRKLGCGTERVRQIVKDKAAVSRPVRP